MKSWMHLAGFVVLSNLAGAIGSVFTFSAIPTWYATLAKPALSPPNWVFGPVWTTLYILMGVAAYLVWASRKKSQKALQLFGLQLALNAVWSVIFFGMQNLALAFAEIVFLWFAIALTIREFYKIDRRAAYLMVPYLLWVTFAGFLNYSIWMLNP